MTASIAERYLRFAEHEVRGKSPLYEELARGAAGDPELLHILERVPESQQQPNLLFATVSYLGGTGSDYASFRGFVLERQADVVELLLTRRTQTNEVGRCAVLYPALARLAGPLALVEVGASAGLCLLPDRYAYEYRGREDRGGDLRPIVGELASPLRLECAVAGPVPLGDRLPEVVFRVGIDLHPLDVRSDEDVRWLEACVWPEQTGRLQRLRTAIEIARAEAPLVLEGDLLELTARVAARAPAGARLVIFHSATLAYVSSEDRRRFAQTVRDLGATWLSNEGLGVLELDAQAELRERIGPDRESFILAQDDRALAFADPHGAWLEWFG
jgi:hypothetical protein